MLNPFGVVNCKVQFLSHCDVDLELSSIQIVYGAYSVGPCVQIWAPMCFFLVKVILIDFQLEKYMQCKKKKDVFNFFLQY